MPLAPLSFARRLALSVLSSVIWTASHLCDRLDPVPECCHPQPLTITLPAPVAELFRGTSRLIWSTTGADIAPDQIAELLIGGTYAAAKSKNMRDALSDPATLTALLTALQAATGDATSDAAPGGPTSAETALAQAFAGLEALAADDGSPEARERFQAAVRRYKPAAPVDHGAPKPGALEDFEALKAAS